MRPVSFTYSGTVGAPIDRVFALITDPGRMPEWLPGCRSVKPAPKLSGKGDRHRIIFERSEEHTSELQSQSNLVCRLLLEKKKAAPGFDASPAVVPRRDSTASNK